MPPSRLVARLVLAGAAALAASVALAASAYGYGHSWSCSQVAANPCNDTSGTLYNPWIEVNVDIDQEGHSGFNTSCAKAVTAAGNTRSPKAGFNYCAAVNAHTTCLAGSQPDSRAYVYWTGAYSGTLSTFGHASTPATSPC